MPSRERVQQLIDYVQQNRIEEAMEEFYADDVVMQENLNPPMVGKAANLERERAFFGAIRVHQNRAASVVVDGDRSTINWIFEFTGPDGVRHRTDQLAYQRWSGDRIVEERFYYDTGAAAA